MVILPCTRRPWVCPGMNGIRRSLIGLRCGIPPHVQAWAEFRKRWCHAFARGAPRLLFIVCLAFGIAGVTLESGYSVESEDNRLDSLIDEALHNNPRIKADYENYLAKVERAKRITAWPNPKFSYAYFGESIETKVGPQKGKYGVSQTVPFPGKLTLKGLAVKKEADILKEKFESAQRELIKNVLDSMLQK